jgi:hypothetical protein
MLCKIAQLREEFVPLAGFCRGMSARAALPAAEARRGRGWAPEAQTRFSNAS